MATHSSVLVWRIPGTGELGGLPSMGSYRVGHDWSDLAAAAAEMYSVFVWYKFLPFTLNNFFSSVQSLSHVRLFVIPWTAACQASQSIHNSQSLLKLKCTELVVPSNHLILCHPLLLAPSIFPRIRVSSSESLLHIRCPKYWSFSFSISLFNEYSGLISFDWLDLLAVQGTLKRLLQHHSSKSSVLRCSAFIVQLSHPYLTTG